LRFCSKTTIGAYSAPSDLLTGSWKGRDGKRGDKEKKKGGEGQEVERIGGKGVQLHISFTLTIDYNPFFVHKIFTCTAIQPTTYTS